MIRASFKSIIGHSALVFIGILTAVVLGEVLLRYIFHAPAGFRQWPPGLSKTFHPDPGALPGVIGPTQFTINSEGIRGDEFSPSQRYRILVIGGSATECLYLDDKVAWPYALQLLLGQRRSDLGVWVGNLGRSGFNTRHHILQMRHMFPQFPNIHTVIALVGMNDMGLKLMMGDDYDPNFLDRPKGYRHLMFRTFSRYPVGFGGWSDFKSTAWWRLWADLRATFFSKQIQDEAAKTLAAQRLRRQEASEIVDKLPNLDSALEEYGRNLNTMVDLARSQAERIIFLTQPSLWRPDLSKTEQQLLWAGGIGYYEEEGSYRYYSVRSLMEAINTYNEKLLEVCHARNVECVDLASMLPKDTTIFYDDCHFNMNGSRKVSEVLADYLLSKPPFCRASDITHPMESR